MQRTKLFLLKQIRKINHKKSYDTIEMKFEK